MDNNNTIPKVKTVHIMLLGMDDRQYAMFRMAFKMHGTTNYELVTEEQGIPPQLVLVDADHAPEAWAKAKERFVQAKVVYFSATPPQTTAPYLAKPIKFDTLFVNLKNLQQGNGIWIARTGTPVAEALVAVPVAATVKTESPQRIEHFDPNEGLLGAVKKASRQESDVAVLHGGKPVLLVFPSIQKVLLTADSAALKALCEQKFVDLSVRPVAEEHLKNKAKLSVQACLWQLAVWTGNGRLPQGIDAHTVFKVKSWPNLTRLAPLAESMRLSAFLTKTSGSLTMLHRLMSIDSKDLADYLTATYVTGYLAVDTHSTAAHAHTAAAGTTQPAASAAGAQQTEAKPAEVPKQRGLLQRLMNKIIGR
ncbi:hypothetical protein [Neisseria shayeganii]|uniref:Uncharacterized protein n=1 Tax=Neisseria shayeganii 871 TaxID=1032488 RepID=G4CIE8_9NEIS|nr:hypothetical protein [Neisseria shayeganii]EGY52419.1 hypothetical protein HMPREF9371_1408 [Neisseria shayeganii 871]